MKLELKNIKMHAGHDDCHCYSGSLYIDGKPVAICENDGWGGMDKHSPHPKSGLSFSEVHAKISEVNKWFRTQPPVGKNSGGEPMYNDVDMACCEMVNAFLAERDLKRMMKRKIVLFKDKQIFTLPAPYRPEHKSVIEQHHKGHVILNALSFPAALRLFREAG